jgi:Chloramphenicol phosphotransferase-like protein
VTTSPIFLVVGAPAVGKSTTSRALAARFERSIHIPVDDLRDMVVSGLVLPNPTWSEQLVEQVGLARRAAIASAVGYADAGFAVVIDDFWDPPGLVEYDEVPADRPFHRVLLRPEREEALRRNFGRHGDDPVRAYLDDGVHHVYDLLATPGAQARLEQGHWLVLDTTQLPVDAAVDRILEHGGVTAPAAPG